MSADEMLCKQPELEILLRTSTVVHVQMNTLQTS